MSCNEWKEYKIGDFITLNYGKSLPKTKRIEGKYNVYGSSGVTGKHNDYLVEGPGIIIGRKGTVGKVSYEENNFFPIDTTYYITQSNEYNLKFIYYFLQTLSLDKMNSHSAVPGLNREAIYQLNVKVPPLGEQEKIANILSSLDDNIELNNEMNKTLEELAQTIFKRWFVDFEFPNENGEPYKSSGGEMVESELGMIPKGWKIKLLGDICDVKGGKRLPKGKAVLDEKTKYPYLRVTDVTSGYVDMSSIKYIDEETREKISRYIIEYNDLYISIAGTIGIVGSINKKLDGASLTENMARIICNNIEKYYMKLYLNSDEIQHIIKTRAVGSTQPKLPLYVIKDIHVLVPTDNVMDIFNNIAVPLFQKIEKNLSSIEEIVEIRETLLPKIMRGEIII